MNERLQKHYEDKYAGDASVDKVQRTLLKKYPRNRLEACLKYFPICFNSGGKILEIGSGAGDLALGLIEDGLQFSSFWLTDLSQNRVQGLQKRFKNENNIVVKHFDLESDQQIDEKFDAVILIDVIEHFIDPIGAVKKIYSMLNKGGVIYIGTPNVAIYYRRKKLLFGKFPSTASTNEGLTKFEGYDVDLFDEGHLHYFTYGSLEGLVNRCKFVDVKKYGYWSGKSFLPEFVSDKIARKFPEMFSDITIICNK